MQKASLEKGGGPPLGGGGIFLWNLLLDVKDFTEVPLSQAYGLPAPLKGSLYTKREPIFEKGKPE